MSGSSHDSSFVRDLTGESPPLIHVITQFVRKGQSSSVLVLQRSRAFLSSRSSVQKVQKCFSVWPIGTLIRYAGKEVNTCRQTRLSPEAFLIVFVISTLSWVLDPTLSSLEDAALLVLFKAA